MAKYRITYSDIFEPSPLSCWVHKPLDQNVPWLSAAEYDPKLPSKIIGKGFPVYVIEHKGYELKFCSTEEIDHCISVLKNKILPTTYQLANNSWMKGYQHLHWLTTWPSNLKDFKNRETIIKLLKKVKSENI